MWVLKSVNIMEYQIFKAPRIGGKIIRYMYRYFRDVTTKFGYLKYSMSLQV